MRFIAAIVVLLALAQAGFAAMPEKGEAVKEVRTRGNLRVEGEKLQSLIKTKTGDPFDQKTVREDLKAIYATGFFKDAFVEYDEEGRITFVVLERPSLRKWEITENDVVKREDLTDKIKLPLTEILKENAVDEAVKVIRELFMEKGYYLARVEYEMRPVEGGKNQVDIEFTVEPREKIRIRHISLPGVPEADVAELKDGLALSERTMWSWLSDSGAFKRAALQRDVEWIRLNYLNRGHAQVEMGEPVVQVTADLLNIEITIPVTPGPVYHVQKILFQGDETFKSDELKEELELKEGDLFTSDALRGSMEKLEDRYANLGYAYARVVPVPGNFTPEGKLDVTFYLQKGNVYRVGRIDTSGNAYTRDRVIRREMRLAEGDLYNRTELNKSDRALKRLGYFKTVDIQESRRQGEPVVDLNINVEEQMTGSFSAGAGFSSADGFMITGAINKNNLFGYGYQIKGEVGFSESRQSYSVTFNNPRLFDTRVFAGVDLYRTTTQYGEYDKESYGARFKLGRSFLDDWHARLTYAIDRSDVSNVCTYEEYTLGQCDNPASLLVQEQEGRTITSSLTPLLSYDTRDNYLDPTSGHYSQAFIEWVGGLLGGDTAYLGYNLDSRQHFPVFKVTSFMLRARGGYLDTIGGQEVPVYERFSLGGINSLRGFDYRSVGPVDEGTVDPLTGAIIRPASGEVIGGNKYFVGNVEYVFPIFPEAKLKGVLFYDFGNAWGEGEDWFSTRVRDSVGFGIRWFSPVGPLRLEYGKNLHPKANEKSAQWEFLIGGYF